MIFNHLKYNLGNTLMTPPFLKSCLKAPPLTSRLTISVLAVISKILERHIATSLSTYLHSYDLLYNLQSAFQPDHTTELETALIKLTDELLFTMDNNMVTGLAFVSFKKAFNVINH